MLDTNASCHGQVDSRQRSRGLDTSNARYKCQLIWYFNALPDPVIERSRIKDDMIKNVNDIKVFFI